MNLHGFCNYSFSYVYDQLQINGIDCIIMNEKAKLTTTDVPDGILLYPDVETLSTWLPLLNAVDNIVFVTDIKQKLKFINNIKIEESNVDIITLLDNIKKENTNFVYTYKKVDIINNLIDEAIKGSFLAILNPILYKTQISSMDRTYIVNEICRYLFEHNNLNLLKKNLSKYSDKKTKLGKEKTNKKYLSLYSFINTHPNLVNFCMKVRNNKNWEQAIKQYKDIKEFEIKYLFNQYKKVNK